MQVSDLIRAPERALRQSVRGKTKDFFYTSAPVTVAAITGLVLGTTQTRINIDGDAHFICTGITGQYLVQTTGLKTLRQLYAEPEIQIQEEGKGFQLFDRPLRWSTIVGVGMRASVLDPPYFFNSRSTILVTFGNPETLAYTCSITLTGYKLYLR